MRTFLAKLLLLLAGTGAALACGGAVVPSSADGSADGSLEDGGDAAAEAGWTQCSAPDGVRVCGGKYQCPECSKKEGCYDTFLEGGVVPCGFYNVDSLCRPGGSAALCVSPTIPVTSVWTEAAWNVGALFAKNGEGDRVRYADMGLFTGDPVPDPTSCPDLSPFQPCGGACGACASGRCIGRGPKHPVGICLGVVPDGGGCDAVAGPGCAAAEACFTYLVEPAAQGIADRVGMCMPKADCASLSAKLPGGAKCTSN